MLVLLLDLHLAKVSQLPGAAKWLLHLFYRRWISRERAGKEGRGQTGTSLEPEPAGLTAGLGVGGKCWSLGLDSSPGQTDTGVSCRAGEHYVCVGWVTGAARVTQASCWGTRKDASERPKWRHWRSQLSLGLYQFRAGGDRVPGLRTSIEDHQHTETEVWGYMALPRKKIQTPPYIWVSTMWSLSFLKVK